MELLPKPSKWNQLLFVDLLTYWMFCRASRADKILSAMAKAGTSSGEPEALPQPEKKASLHTSKTSKKTIEVVSTVTGSDARSRATQRLTAQFCKCSDSSLFYLY